MPGNAATARGLGYAGLIPFIVFSIGCWVPLPYVDDALAVLITYAAVILSFMGAVHWGAAMTVTGKNSSRSLVVSVLPALAAWAALMSPALPALGILLTGFILLYFYDAAVARSVSFPAWYAPMRKHLTIVVSVCLGSALLFVLMSSR